MKFEKFKNIIETFKGKKHELVEMPNHSSIRVLQIDDLRNDNLLKFTNDSNGVFADENDLLLAWDGANAGTIGYGKNGYAGSTIAVLRKKKSSNYDTSYLGKFLQSKSKYLRKKSEGATIPHIDRKSLENLEIPKIDLVSQIRIATVLSRTEALIAQRKESIKLLDMFLVSTFLKMFTPYFTHQYSKKLNSLCTKITDGTHDTPERLKKGIKFITGKHIRPYIIDFDNSDYVTEEVHTEIYRRCNPEFGDILYTNIGVNLGTAAMNTVDYEFSMKNVALLKIDKSQISSRYLEHFLNLPIKRNMILNFNSSGGAQQFLSLTQIKNIDISLPPIQIQKKFSEIVEKTEILKAQFKESLIELENLFGSLSQRAFNGELDLDFEVDERPSSEKSTPIYRETLSFSAVNQPL